MKTAAEKWIQYPDQAVPEVSIDQFSYAFLLFSMSFSAGILFVATKSSLAGLPIQGTMIAV